MGWDVRHGGRRYLYRNRGVNGRTVKESSPHDRLGFGVLVAADLARVQRRGAKLRALARRARTASRARVDDLFAAAGAANATLRVFTKGTLYTLGFHRH